MGGDSRHRRKCCADGTSGAALESKWTGGYSRPFYCPRGPSAQAFRANPRRTIFPQRASTRRSTRQRADLAIAVISRGYPRLLCLLQIQKTANRRESTRKVFSYSRRFAPIRGFLLSINSNF